MPVCVECVAAGEHMINLQSFQTAWDSVNRKTYTVCNSDRRTGSKKGALKL